MAEIIDQESFEEWLVNKPKEWAQVLAARIALRVLPLVGRVFVSNSAKINARQELIIASFRAAAISWAARKYPAHDMVIPLKLKVFKSRVFLA